MFIWWEIVGRQVTLTELLQEWEGLYRSFATKGNLNIQKLLLIKENQISQVKEFRDFLGKER